MMRMMIVICLLIFYLATLSMSDVYQDRFVWIFGWGLRNDAETDEMVQVLETAGKHGFNGAVLSAGLDRLCKRDDDYFRRLEEIKQVCQRYNLELIPAVFSVGYGGSILSHDRNLAEGLPVVDADFIVEGNSAHHVPDPNVQIVNGNFEEFRGDRMRGFNFHDKPGEITFSDTKIKHSGNASLRFENFQAHRARNARVMQKVKVQPYRCYRASVWVKTENLRPTSNFRMLVLAGERNLAPRNFNISPTRDWRKMTMIFNSLNFDTVRLYAGVWNGQSGRFWLDDWKVEEVGPLNVLHRPGTPVAVKSQDGSIIYEEGKDYAPLVDPDFKFRNVDRPASTLELLAGSRIQNGKQLSVSWYHPMVINKSQVTVCMAEPALYEIFEHEAELLWKHLRPNRVLLNMDEVRMGGSCQACQGKDMAQLLGECVTRQVQALRKFNPKMKVYVWSDMLDPNHNAHADYYLVQGDFTGTWNHVPKDLIIAVWGGAPREKSLRFFEKQGFRTLIACYYDADNLDNVKGWSQLAKPMSNVRGFMYTTWKRKYDLLDVFGDLLLDK